MKVRFTPEARVAVREKRAWWTQHRDNAPDLFVEVEVVLLWNPTAGRTPDLTRCEQGVNAVFEDLLGAPLPSARVVNE